MTCCFDRPYGDQTFSKTCPFTTCRHIKFSNADVWIQHIVGTHPRTCYRIVENFPAVGTHMTHMLLRRKVTAGTDQSAMHTYIHNTTKRLRDEEDDVDEPFDDAVRALREMRKQRLAATSAMAEQDDALLEARERHHKRRAVLLDTLGVLLK